MKRLGPLALLVATALFGEALGVGCGAPTSTTPPPAAPLASTSTSAPAPATSAVTTSTRAESVWRQDAKMPVSSDDPALGPRDARVTIVVFEDFQCPFCQRSNPTLERLRERHGDLVRVVWKDLPLAFHTNATRAAIAARVAFMVRGNDAFWKLHDKLFAHQTELTEENVAAWLVEVGVGRDDYEAHKDEAAAHVKASVDAANALGISATPSFLIDGETLTGAQAIERFEEIVGPHLEKAAELAGQGVAPVDMYSRLSSIYWSAPKPPTPVTPAADDATVWHVEIGDAPTLGPADALVTIVTFSDFQCPFCRRLEPTLKQLRIDYGNKLRFVFKNNPLPFHPHAMPAAIVAMEAFAEQGNAGFWKMHDAIFAADSALEDTDLQALATQLGFKSEKMSRALSTQQWKARIELDVAQAKALQATGTPSSFVNGRALVGAQPYDMFKQLVDAEYAKAEARVKAGVRPSAIYAETIKGGKTGPTVVEPKADQIVASHILVSWSGCSRSTQTRTKEEALRRVREALAKITSGRDFAAVAREYSDDASRERGGDLGPFDRASMVKEFSDVAFTLKVGAVSDVVETPFGFHIIKRTK